MTKIAKALLLTAALPLAACGNDPNQPFLGKTLVDRVVAKKEGREKVTPQALAAALANTTGPMELVTRESDPDGWTAMLRIEQNAGYETFGSSDRRTLTMRQGIITASRGLGGDLMSSDVSRVMPLISGRKNGQATRVMRFLDGEDRTVSLQFTCTVNAGKTVPVKTGLLNTTAQMVTETCRSDSYGFTNTYAVTAQGQSVGSKQWLGELNGPLLLQTLRR